jgi:sortase (surface protein transpeptidase)
MTGVPVRIEIPAIHVDAALQRLHRDAAGVLQPPDSWTEAGWYAGGVVPGAVGPAVIAGHLDTTKRVAVFVDLRLLRPGDRIRVLLSTKRTVTFVVTHAKVVRKALFPTAEVYGPTPDAQLRLITCSEPFDEQRGIYADNLVVFATRTS